MCSDGGCVVRVRVLAELVAPDRTLLRRDRSEGSGVARVEETLSLGASEEHTRVAVVISITFGQLCLELGEHLRMHSLHGESLHS